MKSPTAGVLLLVLTTYPSIPLPTSVAVIAMLFVVDVTFVIVGVVKSMFVTPNDAVPP